MSLVHAEGSNYALAAYHSAAQEGATASQRAERERLFRTHGRLRLAYDVRRMADGGELQVCLVRHFMTLKQHFQ